MFTVKATYRSETRKFTFTSSFFPTYREICDQLIKVFPVAQSFYISILSFYPYQDDVRMISGEADTAERYDELIAPFCAHPWPGALLKFSVYDHEESDAPVLSMTPNSCKRKGKEPEHDDRASKRSSLYSEGSNTPLISVPPVPTRFPHYVPQCGAPSAHRRLPSPPTVPYSLPIPPPPILYPSPIGHTSQIPMDVDPAPAPALAAQWQRFCTTVPAASPHHPLNTPTACCDVAQGRQDVQKAVSDFICTLTRVAQTFDPGFKMPEAQSAPPASAEPMPLPREEESSTAAVNNEFILPIPGSFDPETPVHANIMCDICESTIRGIRHKCLDCPDYDMCTSCITNRRMEHAASHEFFKIEKPGHVIVHTVFSGSGDEEKDSTRPRTGRNQSTPRTPVSPSTPPVVHSAICDLCDSRIRGDRYKCLNCPDFDTCSSCFTITSSQHPNHNFVKVKDTSDLIVRNKYSLRHSARCDGCDQTIHGIRYKCTTCPDFDLCEKCEAHPIPVHPPAHDMLKIKIPHIPRIRAPVSCRRNNQSSKPPSRTTHDEVKASHLTSEAKTPSSTLQPVVSDNAPTRNPASFLTPSVADLITFSEASQLQAHNDSSTTPILPQVECTGPLLPDLNVLIEETAVFDQLRPFGISLPQNSSPILCDHVEAPSIRLTAVEDVNSDESESSINTFGTSSVIRSLTPSKVSSVPRIENFSHEHWRDLWPEMREMFNNILPVSPALVPPCTSLNAPVSSRPVIHAKFVSDIASTSVTTPTELASIATNEEASQRTSPVIEGASSEIPTNLKSANQSPSTTPPNVLESPVVHEPEAPLRAIFLSDNNIADGQVFPPGAEFVKSWKVLNDGSSDWPETTQLIFVAGDRLTMENNQGIVPIGHVQAGKEVDIWTGEMKAPEVPGKYVSYWRLNDGRGSHFGHSLWADITVAEPQNVAEPSEPNSLASSAVIMPSAAPVNEGITPGTSVSVTEVFNGSDNDDSDISVVDIPSSLSISSEDSEDWEDTREDVVRPENGVEYVVLYDDSSDDD